jgi:hypothetical protein
LILSGEAATCLPLRTIAHHPPDFFANYSRHATSTLVVKSCRMHKPCNMYLNKG